MLTQAQKIAAGELLIAISALTSMVHPTVIKQNLSLLQVMLIAQIAKNVAIYSDIVTIIYISH